MGGLVIRLRKGTYTMFEKGDRVFIPIVNVYGVLQRIKIIDEKGILWLVNIENTSLLAVVYEKHLIKLGEIKFTNFRR